MKQAHELFAGTGAFAEAAAARGAAAFAWELKDGGNCMTARYVRFLKALICAELLSGVLMGLDCASWSQARMRNPIRHWHKGIWGLRGISERDKARVREGNRQARWCARIFERLAGSGVPVAIENPASSLLWFAPPFRRLLERFSWVDVDMCSCGTPYRKRTRFLVANWDTEPLKGLRCVGRRGVCSFSGLQHVELVGGSNTRPAAAYPPALARALARGLR